LALGGPSLFHTVCIRRSPSVSPTFYIAPPGHQSKDRRLTPSTEIDEPLIPEERSSAPATERKRPGLGLGCVAHFRYGPQAVSKPAEAEDLRKRWLNVGETELLELKKYGPTSSALQSAADLVHKAKDEGIGLCTKPFYGNSKRENNLMLAP
jgi:hypothetical protein